MAVLTELLGESPAVVGIRQTVARLLQRRGGGQFPPILIQGETGTGKGLIARGIHRASARAAGAFVDLNCAAIPETLLEAELFGFERGAFTDARQAKPGLFQAAHGGTIFLDEIGLVPEGVQAKLLKVLEDRRVRRLGGTRSEPIDVAIIAATNENLARAVRDHRFRADLYHRLAVVTITLPPLRERGDDVLLLAEQFLARACREYQLPSKQLTADARAALRAYAWPGNVREVGNVIERAALLGDGEAIDAEALELPHQDAPVVVDPSRPGPLPTLYEKVAAVEREQIVQALEETGWNLSRTAARLGIARNTLRYRMTRFGVSRHPRPSIAEPDPLRPRRAAAPRGPEATPTVPAEVDFERHQRTVAALRVSVAPAPGASMSETGRAVEAVVERLQGFGGQVERIGVEGCLALFGLEPVEDAARRAASAAVAIRQSAERDNARDLARVRFRAALEVRAVVVSRFGRRWEVEAAAKQELGAALEALLADADPGTIAVGDAAVPFLDRRFDLERSTPPGVPRAVVRLKGTERSGYELHGRVTRFVGRHAELDQLQALVQASTEHRGHVVGVVGEPGAGKSRLLLELRRAVAALKIRWMETACVPHGASIPFLPVLAPLRGCFELGADAPATAVTGRVRDKVRATGVAEEIVPALLSLFGALPDPHPFAVLPPAERRQRVVDAVIRLLLAETQAQPVGFVVEDVHWIDRESQEVLDGIARRAAGSRLAVFVTYRPEYHHGWDSLPGYVQLRLGPLLAVNATELLDDLLGHDPSLAPLKPGLVERAGGNPFFLEESVRTLVEDGVITGSPGAYHPTGRPLTATTPPTVRAALAGRIDRLPGTRRRVLQCAAVIGRTVGPRLLQRIIELPETVVRQEASELRAAQFFQDARDQETEYVFRHALTQEVAYDSLPDLDRVQLHARVVAAMEALWPGAGPEHAEVLADHALRGEVWDRAVDYLRMAGAKAYDRSALPEAIARYEQALTVVSRLPASPDTARRSIDVRLDLHAPLMTVGRVQQIAALYPDAERLARELNDGSRLGRVLQRMSQIAWLDGRYRLGARYAQQALAVADVTRDSDTRLNAHYFLGLHRHALGDYAQAIPCFSYVVEGPEAHLASLRSITIPLDIPAWCWHAYAFAMTGDFARAHESLRRALELAEASDFLQTAVIAHTIEGLVFAYAGRAEERLAAIEEAVALCERIGFFVWLGSACAAFGLALARSGKVAAALPHFERGVAINEKSGLRAYQAQWQCWWAEGLLRAGQLDEARGRVETALELAATMEERGVEAEALLVRGMVARAHGRDEEARDWLQRGLVASTKTGARPVEAHCRLALAGALQRLGDRAEAERLLHAAHTMFGEMGATAWWPDRYWRA